MVQQRNIPCILTLHQPQSSIFKLLDSLILLAPGGRVCYVGPSNEAVRYFAKLGFPCPTQTNPAEFLLDLVSIDSEDPRQASDDDLRIARLAAAFAEQKNKPHIVDGSSSLSTTMLTPSNFLPALSPFRESGGVSTTTVSAQTFEDISVFNQAPRESKSKQRTLQRNTIPNPVRIIQRFGRLLLRSWRQNYRNHKVNLIRLAASIGNAYLFTRIFQSIKMGLFTSRSVADRVALLSFAVVNMSMLALMKTVELFAKEKPVVLREQQRHQYTSLEYLMAKAVAEIPLDTVFAALFTTSLKSFCGLRISWEALTATFSLMTVAGASLGFAIGSLSPSGEVAMTAAMPVMIILMMVGKKFVSFVRHFTNSIQVLHH
jgi:ABC-2 type transporter